MCKSPEFWGLHIRHHDRPLAMLVILRFEHHTTCQMCPTDDRGFKCTWDGSSFMKYNTLYTKQGTCIFLRNPSTFFVYESGKWNPWPGQCSQYNDSLRAGWARDQIPVEGDFPHPSRLDVQPTQPLVQRVSGSLTEEVKQSGCGVDHPPTSSLQDIERVELHLYSPSGLSWPVLGWTLPFIFFCL